MESVKLSKALMQRLPAYLALLQGLPGEDCNISATAIANALGLGDVQVRKDLAQISKAGRRRTGRSRNQLIRDIERQLNFTASATAVMVGPSMVGQALLEQCSLEEAGLQMVACFDSAPTASEAEIPVYPMSCLESFCRCCDVRIGIIAVAPEDAQKVCDDLVAGGIQGIWNFSPVNLKVPRGIAVQNENFAVSINALRIQLKNMDMPSRIQPGILAG